MTQDPLVPKNWYGHSQNGIGGSGKAELLRDHIDRVADLSARFAVAFSCSSQAKSMALLHDLGKYSHQFQRRLVDPREKGRDHASIGALLAAKVGKAFGEIPACCIEGHHIGLGRAQPYDEFIYEVSRLFKEEPDRFTSTEVPKVLDAFRADGFEVPTFNSGFTARYDYLADMLDTRMLFSSLVDADFLETESHFAGDAICPRRPRPEGQMLDVSSALKAFDQYMDTLAKPVEMSSSDATNRDFERLRQRLLEECRAKGIQQAPGLFTLSAPTGAGKTLAMLGFALEHARKHGLRRIVLVMPFLNIVDQTARVYRQIFDRERFGDEFILECHSLADDAAERLFDGERISWSEDDINFVRRRRRLLSENWDAPIILTTSVQLFESLFAHKPSRCRKLHRLAGSVILFDEVQTLPPNLVVATLGTLNRLAGTASPYHTSVVFATATQPAFESLSARLNALVDKKQYAGKTLEWKPVEVVSNSEAQFRIAARRVRVEWRYNAPVELGSLARELAKHHQVLAIVNLKRHAIDLAESTCSVVGDTFHLSTNMCSKHRLCILDEVQKRLCNKQAVRLIATQCVEAGVDIDFPRVYRALAPLEAIAQAAGRCNRSGRLPEPGVITVFKPLDIDGDGRERRLYPPGYVAAVNATEGFLNYLKQDHLQDESMPEVINSPERLRQYYEMFYAQHGRDKRMCGDEQALIDAIRMGDFPEVAKQYRLIEHNVINVLVPHDMATYTSLVAEANRDGMNPRQVRAWVQRARPYSVAVYRPKVSATIWNQLLPLPLGLDADEESNRGISTDAHDWWRPTNDSESYDEFVGLKFAGSQWIV